MVKNKKPGHIDTHRQTNSESPPKSICVYVTRRSNCRWPPKCSPLYLFYQTDTLYKSGTHLFWREPITNRAGPDSPKIPFSGPIQIYQHNILLSIRQKHVDGFWRQRNCSPNFHYLASRAYPYRFCKLASRVRIAVYYFASSVQIRTCANFCTGSLGTHPKPRNHTSCELREKFAVLSMHKKKKQDFFRLIHLFAYYGSDSIDFKIHKTSLYTFLVNTMTGLIPGIYNRHIS